MVFKIKISKNTDEIFQTIDRRTGLKPYTLVKHAIAWSVREQKQLSEIDFETDSLGQELNRQTITANYDTYFKAIVEQYEGRQITDEEFFPKYVKAHIDRGARILDARLSHAGTLDQYILSSLGVGDTV